MAPRGTRLAHTSPGIALRYRRRSTTCNASCPASCPPTSGRRVTIAGWVHRRRLLKSVAFLIVRDAAGLAQVVVTEPALRAARRGAGRGVRGRGRRHGGRQRRRPRPASRSTEPTVRVLSAAEPPPFDLYRPTLTATLPTLLDHAAVALRHPPRQAAFRLGAAAVARLPVHTGRGRLRRGAHPEDRRVGDRVGGERVRASTTSAAGVPGPVAAVLQADAWSACSSGSTRSVRCSGPSRTTPCATWPSTPRSTWSSASSRTTAT